MASNANIYTTGYDVQVVGDFLPHLNCGICLFILRDAMHGCRNHVFCKVCITKHIEFGIKINGNVMCPGGCNIVINPAKLEVNKFTDQMVNTLTTRCLNANCTWKGDLLDLVQVHQINCNFLLQACVNNGCNQKYLKKDILQHNEECLFNLLQCSYCQTDILRMNKEAHDVKCLNERVKCIYYDIGCKEELCRNDIYLHEQTSHAEHTRLVYQNLTNSNYQIKDLKLENNAMQQENMTMKEEIVVLKQEILVLQEENITFKKKLEGVEVLQKENIENLEQQVQNETTGFQILQKKKFKLKNRNSKTSDKIGVASNEVVLMKSKEEVLMKSKEKVKNIDSLKLKLNKSSALRRKVSLVDDDKVLIIKSNKNERNSTYQYTDFTKCYKANKFDWMFNNFGLMNNKSTIMELLNNTKYHFYEYICFGDIRFSMFVFQLDLHHIKDTEVLVPNMFKMTIIDNEIMVEVLNYRIKNCYFLIGKDEMELKHQEKMNLQELFITKGYAFLIPFFEK